MSFALIQITVKKIESLSIRMTRGTQVPQSPLSDTACLVSGFLEQAGYGHRTFGQNMHIITRNGSMTRMLSGQINQTRRTTHGMTGVMIREK